MIEDKEIHHGVTEGTEGGGGAPMLVHDYTCEEFKERFLADNTSDAAARACFAACRADNGLSEEIEVLVASAIEGWVARYMLGEVR